MGLFSRKKKDKKTLQEVQDSSASIETNNNEGQKVEEQEQEKKQESQEVRIVPRIKVDYSHGMYQGDAGKQFMGKELPADLELPDGQKPYFYQLNDDLLVCYAFDMGNVYNVMNIDTFEGNESLSQERVHAAALANMVSDIGENIKVQGDPNDVVMVTCGGNFEAAMILLEGFWEQMHQAFEGSIIFSIPARDLLFLSKKDNQPALEKQKEMVKSFFDNEETEGLLSKGIYMKEVNSSKLELISIAF